MGLARPLRRRSVMLQGESKGWRKEAESPQQSPSLGVDSQGSVNRQDGRKGDSLPTWHCP